MVVRAEGVTRGKEARTVSSSVRRSLFDAFMRRVTGVPS
jgi:hypothetical protein